MGADLWLGCHLVETIPGKLGGRPVLRDTRVEADLIPESLELGQTAEEIAAVYRLDLKDVLGVRDYYLAQSREVAPVG